MFIQLFLLLFLLLTLFLLSQKISSYFYTLIFFLTGNQQFALGILIILFLPGTVIHEISHFVIATILRVPTGELSVMPTIEENGKVKAGKLTIAQVDLFRQAAVGLAPTLIGLIVIYLIGKIFLFDTSLILNTKYLIPNTVYFYFLFSISVTMFLSKKDLESVWPAALVSLLILLSFYFIGVRIFFEETLIGKINPVLSDLNKFLIVTALINYFVFFTLSANLILWQKILKRKIRKL